jgi:hypothetical protein
VNSAARLRRRVTMGPVRAHGAEGGATI